MSLAWKFSIAAGEGFTLRSTDLWLMLCAYLVGTIPVGLLAGKLKGIDIRRHGSGNIGATNVMRTLGRRCGLTVFVLDFLKGLLPVLLAFKLSEPGSLAPILAAVGAVLGHNYPVWLRFKGGKGIATSGGALLGVLPWAFVICIVVWVVTFMITRYVSMASMLAATAIPVTAAVLLVAEKTSWSYFCFAVILAALAIWRHRPNIQRLISGTEPKFKRSSGRPAHPPSGS